MVLSMPPSSSSPIPRRQSPTADTDSDEDEQTNDVAFMLERMKLPSTLSDYDLAKVFQQKLDLDDVDAALHLAKALREFSFQKNGAKESAAKDTEKSKENDTQARTCRKAPISIPKRLTPLNPNSSTSTTPPRPQRKSPKPWNTNLDINGSSSVPKIHTPCRRSSAREIGDERPRSKSPFRRLFQRSQSTGAVTQINQTIQNSCQAAKGGETPSVPDDSAQTFQKGTIPPISLTTPLDEAKQNFEDTFLSPPSTTGSFFTTPNSMDTPGSASMAGILGGTSCATGAHKNRRTTATPFGLGTAASLAPHFLAEENFQKSTSTSNDSVSAGIDTNPDVLLFSIGVSNAKKHNRVERGRSRRTGKIKVSGQKSTPLEQTNTPTADTRNSNGFFSPMDEDPIVDDGPVQQDVPVVHAAFPPEAQPSIPNVIPVNQFPMTFSIGDSKKIVSPSNGRCRRTTGRKATTVGRRGQQNAPTIAPRRLGQPSGSAISSEQYSNDTSVESCENDTNVKATPLPSTNVYEETQKAYVKSLREDARNSYLNEDFKSSVLFYTKALLVHCRGNGDKQTSDDVRAVLLANRGAALMMMTAYSAAVRDCLESITYTSSGMDNEGRLPSDGGPILKCKVLIRLGRSFLKLGQLDNAMNAFEKASETEAIARSLMSKQCNYEAYLTQTLTDAAMGSAEAKQCRDIVYQLQQLGMTSLESPFTATRRNNLQALSLVNTALNVSSGSMDLHSMQIAILAALKRWREIACCCERLASERTRFDGAFTEDLEMENPTPGVPPAIALNPSFFEGDDFKVRKLSSKSAVVDAVLRLPESIVRFYITALRLEERYQLSFAAVDALEGHLKNRGNLASVAIDWLKLEKGKLERTIKLKEDGDNFYLNAKYEAAMKKYSACFLIDGEGRSEVDGSNGGGKLHAVLLCNRAACFMSMARYSEAIKDCTAALRIHNHYMKAMLRRSRCYVRLARFDEAIAEYEHYINLVLKYKKGDVHEHVACLFDGPAEVTNDGFDAVKNEMNAVKRSKLDHEKATRDKKEQEDQRRKWYSESFGQGKAGEKSGDDAQRRRDQWYSQQGANEPRRWDSFNGRGPHPNSKPTKASSWRQYSESYSEGRRQEESRSRDCPPSTNPVSETVMSHYTVLQLPQTASDADIKKGYRQMALKYHPDKNQEANASDLFRRIKLAYDVLSDPVTRRQYDLENRLSRRY